MRFVNADGRAGLLVGAQVFDLEKASGGEVSSDPMTVITDQWDTALAVYAKGAFDGGVPLSDVHLGPPVPAPRAIYGVGLNYRSHAEESNMPIPGAPAIFTKFPTSLTGPHDEIVLPKGKTMSDWEAELAFVTRAAGRYVGRDAALDALLGFTVAQDISERATQFACGGQFSMGKSFDTFCPLGPAIVTLDELGDSGRLHIVCKVNGEVKQDAYTDDLIFDIPALVEFISSVCTLRAGDLCLTGTPAGVGVVRGEFLQPGDVIDTEIEGVGSMRNPCVAEG